MHTALRIFASLLLTTVAACKTIVPTSPESFTVETTALSHLRRPQTVALINAYKSPTEQLVADRFPKGSDLYFDLKQVTNTAIVMLSRAMEEQGIRVAPQAEADKTVFLSVQPVKFRTVRFFPHTREARVVLNVEYWDGTRFNVGALYTSSKDPYGINSTEGALLLALINLVRHKQFIAYINR